MLIFLGVMTALAAVGTYLTERIDRPRRAAERAARAEAR